MRTRLFLFFITSAALSACQTPILSGSQCVLPPGSLASASTFSWKPFAGIDVVDDTGYISPLVVSALQKAVEDELASKGFREIQSEGDSDIELSLVLRTRRELVSYEQGPNPCRDNDCWEVIDPGSNVRMDLRTTGFLAADIYVQNQPVWRGWVETTLYPKDRDAAGEVIARAIPKLFESFPP